MRYGTWLTWGSILTILVLSVMSYFQLIEHKTLGLFEALLLCGVWLGANAGKYTKPFFYILVIVICVVVVIVVVWLTHPLLFIYVPAIAINLLLAGFFFNSLRPGSEPAISRIARSIRQDDFDDELCAYTRGVTWAWALFFTGLVIEAIVLITFGSIEITVLFLNLLNYVLITAFFIAENFYRRIHLRHHAHTPFLVLVSQLSRKGVMSLIR